MHILLVVLNGVNTGTWRNLDARMASVASRVSTQQFVSIPGSTNSVLILSVPITISSTPEDTEIMRARKTIVKVGGLEVMADTVIEKTDMETDILRIRKKEGDLVDTVVIEMEKGRENLIEANTQIEVTIIDPNKHIKRIEKEDLITEVIMDIERILIETSLSNSRMNKDIDPTQTPVLHGRAPKKENLEPQTWKEGTEIYSKLATIPFKPLSPPPRVTVILCMHQSPSSPQFHTTKI